MLIKKYGNRRLYDTDGSRYITLVELTEKIKAGAEVRVVDAKTNTDLTQETLTQIIIEGRGADSLLPVPLLHQMIRLGDDALADFLGRYVQSALELYLQARKGSQAVMPFNAITAMNPFLAGNPYAAWGAPPSMPQPHMQQPQQEQSSTDVEQLRRELDELKRSMKRRRA